MRIPLSLEQEVRDSARSHLATELARRGLALTADEVAAADADMARLGARLLIDVLDLYFPRNGADTPAVEFDSAQTADRLQAALAFGALTARVLSPVTARGTRLSETFELPSALFNVGIGLIDGLCDEEPALGTDLLGLFSKPDLLTAALSEPADQWLRSRLPPRLLGDDTVSFTADVVEAFFVALHAAHPRERGLSVRGDVAVQLSRALDAERVSVGPSSSHSREQLLEASRLTSVVPFEIIETLVRAGGRNHLPTSGTSLGEAVWRIDDLVDVCDDAHSGALNSILIGADHGPWRPDDERTVVERLERLLSSSDLAEAAGAAAEALLLGLGLSAPRRPGQERPSGTVAFLGFIQDYAGIPPQTAS